jgi:hypothetical protein
MFYRVQPTLESFGFNKKARFWPLYSSFNRTYDGDFGVGLNYTVSYFIFLRRKWYQLDSLLK